MGKIPVKIKPAAKRVEIKKEQDVIKIKLKSKPEGGKANKELINILSKVLKVPKSSIIIVVGKTARNKVVEVKGMDNDEIERRLLGQ